MKTTEGNKLIAEFMGLKPESDSDNRYFDCPNRLYEYDIDHYKISNTCTPERMIYHKSWDWLMPVVEKISMTGYLGGIKYALFDALGNANLEAAYKEIVSYIKWYNEKMKYKESILKP